MSEVLRISVQNFQLTVNGRSYLVEVKETREDYPFQVKFSDVPEWVFGSKHAIWLSDTGSTVPERARKGDEIKTQILARLAR